MITKSEQKYMNNCLNVNIDCIDRLLSDDSNGILADMMYNLPKVYAILRKYSKEKKKYRELLIKIYWNTTCKMTKDVLLSKSGINFNKALKDHT